MPSTQTPFAGQLASVLHGIRRHTEEAASQVKSGGHPVPQGRGSQWCAGEHVSPGRQLASSVQPGAHDFGAVESHMICVHTWFAPADAQSESAAQVVAGAG
jgi:hypothetical protein